MDEQVCDARTGETFRRPTTANPAAEQAIADAVAAEEANAQTLRERADAALAVNAADIAEGEQWLATYPSGTLTTAVLSAAVRYLVRVMVGSLKQRNALIRLTLRKLDSVAGTQQAGGK